MRSRTSKLFLIKAAFFIGMIVCLTTNITSPLALIIGFLFSHFLGHPFYNLNRRAVSWLLKVAVVGIGFGLSVEKAISASKSGFSLTIFSIAIILIVGFVVARALKIDQKIGYLISSGTAICGGSAIAAVSPVIDADEKEISISLGVVFLFNSVALLIFPLIGDYLGLTEHQFGLWCAIAIHDTSSVVGAASTFGNTALDVATTVKMARVLWIIPLSVISMIIFKGKSQSINPPWFIVLFIGAILLNSYLSIDHSLITSITFSSKKIMVLTLFLVGAGLSIDKIKSSGWKPIVLGLLLWVTVSIFSISWIMH